jgi:hypothetical protein
MELGGMTAALRKQYNIKDTVNGVVVTKIDANSPASEKRVQAGDVIVEINQQVVKEPGDVIARMADAKKQGRIVNVEVSREGYEDTDDVAAMRMVNHWVSEADKSVQLTEVRRTEIRPIDGAKSWFMIIDLEFSPPKGKTTTFGATGFGLVAVRMAKSIGVHDGGGRILNSEGQLNEEAVFRKPARWCDYSGRITNDTDGFGGITLMNHPMNPHNPTAFHVRNDGWMGCCLSLDTPVQVTEQKKLRVRYALWVHDGVASQAESEAHWQKFIAMPVVDLALKPAKK